MPLVLEIKKSHWYYKRHAKVLLFMINIAEDLMCCVILKFILTNPHDNETNRSRSALPINLLK